MTGATIALAVDPGTRKCGVAVVRSGSPCETLHRAVVPTADLAATVAPLIETFQPAVILVGDATHAGRCEAALHPLLSPDTPLHKVPEAFTSEKARERWRRENPPTTLWGLCFPGFRTPDCAVDDYAAVILAERFFAGE